MGGRGVIETCRLLMAAALSSRSYVIRIVFSLPMSSSFVCWISPTAVRKKVARVPLGRGLKVPKCENFHLTDFFYFFTIKSLWVGNFRAKIKILIFRGSFWGFFCENFVLVHTECAQNFFFFQARAKLLNVNVCIWTPFPATRRILKFFTLSGFIWGF